jgi:hypothetical protein
MAGGTNPALSIRDLPKEQHVRRPLLALCALAALALPACGPTQDERAGGKPNEPVPNSSTSPPIGGGGSFCDQWRTGGPQLTDAYRKATVEPNPAALQTDFDVIVAEESALAAAAPNELQPDYRVILQVLQQNRATLVQANWTAVAFVRTLSTNLADNDYVTASADIATYLHNRCGIDVTNPTAA